MKRVLQLRVYPNIVQIMEIEETFGVLRFLWNQYLDYNAKLYKAYKEGESEKGFVGYKGFRPYLMSELIQKYPWIEIAPDDARSWIGFEAERAYMDFFRGKSDFPKFKSKHKNPVRSIYFRKRGGKLIHDYMIDLPVFRFMKFDNKGYVKSGLLEKLESKFYSGKLVKDQYGRYFVSLIIDEPEDELNIIEHKTLGFGIDLGIKSFATVYDGENDVCFKISHPWRKESKTKLPFYMDRINALQRIVSNKVEINKKKGVEHPYQSNNIKKVWKKINKYRMYIHDYMDNFLKKLCNELVAKAKPVFIVLENLSITDMLQNEESTHKFHDIIAKSNWYKFKYLLVAKAEQYGCTVYEANRYFPSSKKCHFCGYKNDITLDDRTITCVNCGETYDRDENAAINLFNLKKSKLKKITLE